MTQLEHEVSLGEQAEAFLASPLGKYLVGRAEAEVEEGVEALKRADPEDAKAIRAIQTIIARAESFQYWLAEAIMAGENAQQELTEEQS
jgi:hypothetical protein